jgi:ribose 5-phosphate isomerase A
VDLQTGPIENPEALQAALLAIPGVFETGLFIGLCDVLIVADASGVEIRNR